MLLAFGSIRQSSVYIYDYIALRIAKFNQISEERHSLDYRSSDSSDGIIPSSVSPDTFINTSWKIFNANFHPVLNPYSQPLIDCFRVKIRVVNQQASTFSSPSPSLLKAGFLHFRFFSATEFSGHAASNTIF